MAVLFARMGVMTGNVFFLQLKCQNKIPNVFHWYMFLNMFSIKMSNVIILSVFAHIAQSSKDPPHTC